MLKNVVVVLLIFKWIGILLAATLSLLLFLCLLILLAPIRYEVYVNYKGELKYRYCLRWCGHLLSVKKKMNSESIRLYLFGIPIRTLLGEKELEEDISDSVEKGIKEVEAPVKRDNHKEEIPDSKVTKKKAAKEKGKRRKKSKKKKKSWIEKLRFQFDKISSIIKFIRDRDNKKVFSMVWQELVSLLRYLSPKRVYGSIHFGTGDPASTGLILGGISLFPWAYTKGLKVLPNFEEQALEAELTAKGKIRLRYIAALAWRLYRSRGLRRTIKKWQNI